MAKVKTFARGLSDATAKSLCDEPLFQGCLLPDIEAGTVFPAIRPNETVDFYHRGGRLFVYQGGEFRTHVKYASVLLGNKGDYVAESDLANLRPIAAFDDKAGYRRIKENCYLFSGDEAEAIASLYSRLSYVCCTDDVVVLDIEIALAHSGAGDCGAPAKLVSGKRRGLDKIDFVLYHKPSKTLRFYEAKCFSNPELRSGTGEPKVAKQLDRYNEQLSQRKGEILAGYQEYVSAVKRLFETEAVQQLEAPVEIGPRVVLFITGFDRRQKGKIDDEFREYKGMQGRRCAIVGKVTSETASNIWKTTREL